MHDAGLVATLAAALGAALIAGYAARRLHLSPILGYLIAGIAIGPYTPGFVGDLNAAAQLSEIGVVLLMFGVGLHFSLADLVAVRSIALPGALLQSAVATALGVLVALAGGWSLGAGLVLGFSLSVASTVVLIRGLTDRGALESVDGRVAVGWLIVEDLFTVLLLVLLPALAGPLGGRVPAGEPGVLVSIGVALGKIALLGVIVLSVGTRVVPWILVRVARAESRELFTLAVLSIALGIAYGAAALFGVSMALGAFLAGTVVARSDLSHRAAADALPLRDAFAVLFFVSVGMLFDPAFLLERPGVVLAALAVVLVAKPLTALLILLALRRPLRTALTAAVGLGQIGEFSFILAALGRSLDLLPAEGSSVILACALLSIAVNPLLFRAIEPIERALSFVPWLRRRLAATAIDAVGESPATSARARAGHVILCGHGRVGSVLAAVLEARRIEYVVVEQSRREVEALRARGVAAINGDAGSPELLDHAGVKEARMVVVALSDPVATRLVVEHALRVNPTIRIVARVDRESERAALLERGRVEPVVGTLEAGFAMARHVLDGFDVGAIESEAAVIELRAAHGYGPPPTRVRFVEIAVPPTGGAAGSRIADLGLPPGALIVLVRRGAEHLVPSGLTELAAGDALLALAGGAELAQVRRLITGAPVPV